MDQWEVWLCRCGFSQNQMFFDFLMQNATRSPKRHVTARDLIFYMEQERETKKSLVLYKTLMK